MSKWGQMGHRKSLLIILLRNLAICLALVTKTVGEYYADTEAISYQSTLLSGSDGTTMLYKKIIFVKINDLHKSL